MLRKKYWVLLLLCFVAVSYGVYRGLSYSEHKDCELLSNEGVLLYDVEKYKKKEELTESEFKQLTSESEENYKNYIEKLERECISQQD
jgi:hypothetical protein